MTFGSARVAAVRTEAEGGAGCVADGVQLPLAAGRCADGWRATESSRATQVEELARGLGGLAVSAERFEVGAGLFVEDGGAGFGREFIEQLEQGADLAGGAGGVGLECVLQQCGHDPGVNG